MNQYLGVGVGLRREHFSEIEIKNSNVDWFEIIAENFINFGGSPAEKLKQLQTKYQIAVHGLSLSLGSSNPLDKEYLEKLKTLLNMIDAPWFSDHLAISSNKNRHYHDLLPVLRTKESIINIVQKIRQLTDSIEKPFLLENISYYVETKHNEIPENEFISEIVNQTGCKLLLDINNVYVNSINHNYNAKTYLKCLPSESIVEIHLAGHTNVKEKQLLVDTHGDYVCSFVWELYEWYLNYSNRKITTLIEWDNSIPPFSELIHEVNAAKTIINRTFQEAV